MARMRTFSKKNKKVISELEKINTTVEKLEPLTVLSFGAGQDSTAILYKILLEPKFKEKYVKGKLIVVFSDTGNEHPETYRHVRYIDGLCHKHKIEFYHLTPDMGYHTKSWSSLEIQMSRNSTIAMRGSKICTDNLKIKPIYRFINHYIGQHLGLNINNAENGHLNLVAYGSLLGKVRMLIGIAKGEESRKEKADKSWPSVADWMRDNVQRVYPLIDIKYGRYECQEYMRNCKFETCVPSNCMMCPYMSKQELLLLSIDHPAEFKKWVKYEKAKLLKFKNNEKNHGVFATKATLEEHLKEAKKKFKDWTVEQLREYRFSHGHCIKNAM